MYVIQRDISSDFSKGKFIKIIKSKSLRKLHEITGSEVRWVDSGFPCLGLRQTCWEEFEGGRVSTTKIQSLGEGGTILVVVFYFWIFIDVVLCNLLVLAPLCWGHRNFFLRPLFYFTKDNMHFLLKVFITLAWQTTLQLREKSWWIFKCGIFSFLAKHLNFQPNFILVF